MDALPPGIYDGLAWDELSPELREALPKDKNDIENARRCVALGYPAVGPVLAHLTRWMQDRNWPVSNVIAPFLAQIGEPLAGELRTVLAGTDDLWIRWVLVDLVSPLPTHLIGRLSAELQMVANRPSSEDIQQLAQDLLARISSTR